MSKLSDQLYVLEQEISEQKIRILSIYFDTVTGDHPPNQEQLAKMDAEVNMLNSLLTKKDMIKQVISELNRNKV